MSCHRTAAELPPSCCRCATTALLPHHNRQTNPSTSVDRPRRYLCLTFSASKPRSCLAYHHCCYCLSIAKSGLSSTSHMHRSP
ncbi:hypothetical protein BKA66DRAFT_153624 [Pyrenochaeta sp. MPI-SDFR-AT-0127]|nr:hypothetical protein BKA66DRAFT_153624 [Pyrenochaeta sp. MPI-SDFR-AT-0127]